MKRGSVVWLCRYLLILHGVSSRRLLIDEMLSSQVRFKGQGWLGRELEMGNVSCGTSVPYTQIQPVHCREVSGTHENMTLYLDQYTCAHTHTHTNLLLTEHCCCFYDSKSREGEGHSYSNVQHCISHHTEQQEHSGGTWSLHKHNTECGHEEEEGVCSTAAQHSSGKKDKKHMSPSSPVPNGLRSKVIHA